MDRKRNSKARAGLELAAGVLGHPAFHGLMAALAVVVAAVAALSG